MITVSACEDYSKKKILLFIAWWQNIYCLMAWNDGMYHQNPTWGFQNPTWGFQKPHVGFSKSHVGFSKTPRGVLKIPRGVFKIPAGFSKSLSTSGSRELHVGFNNNIQILT